MPDPVPDLPGLPTERSIVIDSLGVGLATGAYGISFGAISVAAGLDVWQTCVLSLLMFTGGSQFAYVGVIGAGGGPMTGALTATLLGSRNLFYGLSLAPRLSTSPLPRLGAAHLVIDESTAMAVTRATDRHARLGFYTTGIAVFLLWNLFTLVGALAGDAIGEPETYGLDAVVGAAFLALLWPRLATWPNRLIALLAAAVALGFVPFTASGIPIMVGGLVAVLIGLWVRR